MDNRICEKFAKCPIFQKGVLFNELTGETYKNLYCLRADKFKNCKRYQASAECSCSIPDTIMPNSSLSVEEIIKRVQEKNSNNI
ncbi:MAG: hypothetical protein J6V76_08520 [Bacteroidales bacterium]|nr:hypothetical protein [Bacteroidales bacterium]